MTEYLYILCKYFSMTQRDKLRLKVAIIGHVFSPTHKK